MPGPQVNIYSDLNQESHIVPYQQGYTDPIHGSSNCQDRHAVPTQDRFASSAYEQQVRNTTDGGDGPADHSPSAAHTEIAYLEGWRLFLSLGSLSTMYFLVNLDATILAAVRFPVPELIQYLLTLG